MFSLLSVWWRHQSTLTVDRRADEDAIEHVPQTAEHDGKQVVLVNHLARKSFRTQQLDTDVDDAV